MMNPPPIPSPPLSQDEEHLKLLALFHYIVAGLGALFACFPLIHVAIGIMFIMKPDSMNGSGQPIPPPAAFGYLFAGMGALFVLAGWAVAICTFISGRYLACRRNRMFSFVMAAVLCMFFPFGTLLGVFTIIVLSRESVKRLYQAPIQ
jgi:hypothetical protein